jgi:cell division protein FtsN
LTSAAGAVPAPPVQIDEPRAERREVTQLRDPRFKPSPVAPGPATGGDRFDIVVASFRTNSRAEAVAAEVAALGLPMRRRVSDGWQQVLSGPFASRADAGGAQQRLARAGMAGTQIVPVVR